MPISQIAEAKKQLAAVIAGLEEKKRNPYKDTPLGELTDEVCAMRRTYGLSYAEIADRLNALKIEPPLQMTIAKIRAFCRFIDGAKKKPAPTRGATANG